MSAEFLPLCMYRKCAGLTQDQRGHLRTLTSVLSDTLVRPKWRQPFDKEHARLRSWSYGVATFS
jgi:hypothetical protein